MIYKKRCLQPFITILTSQVISLGILNQVMKVMSVCLLCLRVVLFFKFVKFHNLHLYIVLEYYVVQTLPQRVNANQKGLIFKEN